MRRTAAARRTATGTAAQAPRRGAPRQEQLRKAPRRHGGNSSSDSTVGVGDLDEYGNEYRHGNMYAVEKCGDHD